MKKNLFMLIILLIFGGGFWLYYNIVYLETPREIRRLDREIRALNESLISAQILAKELGKDAEYVLEYSYISTKSPYKDPMLGTSANFIADFKKASGIVPDGTQCSAVSAGIVYQTAIRKAGLTPPLTEAKRVKLREELAKTDIETAAGPVRFDPIGFNEANPLCIFQIQKGKAVCVDPKGLAEAPLVYPAPVWHNR